MKNRGVLFLVASMLGISAMQSMPVSAAMPAQRGAGGCLVTVQGSCPEQGEQKEEGDGLEKICTGSADLPWCLAAGSSCPVKLPDNVWKIIKAVVQSNGESSGCSGNGPTSCKTVSCGTVSCGSIWQGWIKPVTPMTPPDLAEQGTDLTESTDPAEGNTPAQSFDPEDVMTPADPKEGNHDTDPSEAVEGNVPTAPSEGNMPSDPSDPIEESTPAGSAGSSEEGMNAIQSPEPGTDPSQLSGPAEGITPSQPSGPAEGITPSQPSGPAEGITPSQPSDAVQAEDLSAVPESRKLTVAGRTCYLGQPVSALGTPAEQLGSAYGFTWYVYGTDTYTQFFAAGVAEGKVVALMATGSGFLYQGMQSGSRKGSYDQTDCVVTIATDKNDSGIVHGVCIKESRYGTMYLRSQNYTSGMLADESRMNFHLTNGFRVYNGLPALKWSDQAAKAARLHSQDMADQNYFAHNSLDGRTPWARMAAQGVQYRTAGENIDCGYFTAFDAYDGWVNSAGHRSNLLGTNFTYLGVGGGYRAGNSYRVFFTQDFYS